MLLDILYIIIIFFLGIGFINLFNNQLNDKDKKVLLQLLIFHLLMGTYYCFFIEGDAIGYWRVPKDYDIEVFLYGIFNLEGTHFVYAFNYLFSNVLNMPYLSNTLLFALFGFMGLTFFYVISVKTIPYTVRIFGFILFPLIFFLPNLHFWSSGIGKDTLLFLCIGMFSYGIMKPLHRAPLLLISIFLSLAIRPHITLFLFLGFGMAYVFSGKVSIFQRVIFSVLLIGLGIALLPTVLEFARIEDASLSSFDEFAEGKSALLSRSGSGSAIDISSYPLPLKLFTFLFRPLFFDAYNINGFVTSAENLILLLLFIAILRRRPFAAFKAAPFVIKGLVLFLIIGAYAFSNTMGNLGIMIRMRNMFLPGFLMFMMWVFSYEQQRIATSLRQRKLMQQQAAKG